MLATKKKVLAMNQDKAKELVESNFPVLAMAMGLDNWKITIQYDRLDNGTAGLCSVSPQYMRATIQIDTEQQEDEADLADTLLHESFHILQAEQKIYMDAVDEVIGNEDAKKALDQLRIFGDERLVVNLMTMLKRIGLDMKQIIRLYKKQSALKQ